MIVRIRQFNADGLSMFSRQIDEIRLRTQDRLPHDFITDNAFSVELTDDIKIEIKKFEDKFEFITYLYPYVKKLRIDNLYFRSPLWSWLAAAFFETICRQREDGSRVIDATDKYILDTNAWDRYYRHLIVSPLRLYHEINNPSLSKIYLFGKPYIHGDILEQLASRQEFATVKGVLEAAIELYWDNGQNRPRAGVTNRKKPGNLRRFIGVLQQFQLTYDLNSMTGQEILRLLPHEFDPWKDQ